jgi:hypothetical protein
LRDLVYGFECAAPGQRDTQAAVAVVVDDPCTRLVLESDATGTGRPEADSNGLGRIDLGSAQRRQEYDAAPVHFMDRLVIVQADVQAPLIRLGQSAQDQHVVPARHNEDKTAVAV